MQRASYLVLTLLLAFPWAVMAVEIVDGPHVEVEAHKAVVRWKTSGVSGSRVRFGTTLDQKQWQTRSAEGVTDAHEITVDGLQPATVYQFTVGTAKRALKEGIFTTASSSSSGSSSISKEPAAPRAPPAAKDKDTQTKLEIPPLRRIWGDMDSLQDHYERHGPDFNSKSAEQYAQQAWLFLQRAIDEGLPAKLDDEDGTIRIFDLKTRSFAAYRRDGRARTYFKPNSPAYFDRQPGKVVKLTRRSH